MGDVCSDGLPMTFEARVLEVHIRSKRQTTAVWSASSSDKTTTNSRRCRPPVTGSSSSREKTWFSTVDRALKRSPRDRVASCRAETWVCGRSLSALRYVEFNLSLGLGYRKEGKSTLLRRDVRGINYFSFWEVHALAREELVPR